MLYNVTLLTEVLNVFIVVFPFTTGFGKIEKPSISLVEIEATEQLLTAPGAPKSPSP